MSSYINIDKDKEVLKRLIKCLKESIEYYKKEIDIIKISIANDTEGWNVKQNGEKINEFRHMYYTYTSILNKIECLKQEVDEEYDNIKEDID